MAVCLGVVPDRYFINNNTKRDYQTANGITKRNKKVASKQGLSHVILGYATRRSLYDMYVLCLVIFE